MNNTEFSSLNLSPALQENLTSLGYLQMTPIQAQSLPLVLDGKDLIAKAKTGSGKTAAFALGLLAKLNVNRLEVQALVLCPTRELADQVAQEIRRLARALPNVKLVTLCGGTQTAPQSATLSFGAHIAVGTPGRILKHLEQGTLELSGLKTLVLDEADRMLDMGFGEEINRVISYAPEQRQTLLFSATYPEGIAQMSRGVQRNPVEVSVESLHEGSAIEQKLYEVHTRRQSSPTSCTAAYRHCKRSVPAWGGLIIIPVPLRSISTTLASAAPTSACWAHNPSASKTTRPPSLCIATAKAPFTTAFW